MVSSTVISRLCVLTLHDDRDHTLTSYQTNVLVGSDGHARIAGLAAAFIPATMLSEDIDRSCVGAAPELIDARPWGFADTGATKASDVYAFGVLACEVREKLVTSPDQPLNGAGFVIRFLLGNLRSPGRVLLRRFIRC